VKRFSLKKQYPLPGDCFTLQLPGSKIPIVVKGRARNVRTKK
jgi:hypothetical protein